jgi:cobalt-zinc-cadmium efflux system protein
VATSATTAQQTSQFHDHHGHTHGHGQGHTAQRSALRLGFLLTLGILVVEVVAGFAAHSLALLSDAGHVLTDALALGLAWFAVAQAERPADARRTFGYHRVGILTALLNGATLALITVGIAFEAVRRLQHPSAVEPAIMIPAAALAIVANVAIGLRLHRSAGESLNARAALLHVVGDVGASAAVIAGAIAILVTGATWIDPALSLLIAAVIALGAVRVVREALNILLEATPRGLSMDQLVRDMTARPGVYGVHDLHVWTISSGVQALSSHVVIADLPPSGSAPILDDLSAMLRDRYGIAHTTLQFESEAHTGHEGFCACQPGTDSPLYCDLRPAADGCAHPHAHTH